MVDLMFGSDNQAAVSPDVLEAMLRCGEGRAVAYGDDAVSARVDDVFSEVFEHETSVVSVATGTAANALGLSLITPPYGETICSATAHIMTTEGGAPEFYAGGSRLSGIPGEGGKISERHLRDMLADRGRPSRHHFRCASLSLTQATEFGLVYSPRELADLCSSAREQGMRVHMDGARFANALVAVGASPAAMSWRAGIDVLSLGTTKNGTMNAEAVIVFDRSFARELAYRQKRAGLLTAKMRYMSAQLLAYLRDELWLRDARHANDIAGRLAQVLTRVSGVTLLHPVQTNQMFVELPDRVTQTLDRAGIRFRPWDPRRPAVYRLVTSFQDDASVVDRVAHALTELS